jgi:hypothetical protein
VGSRLRFGAFLAANAATVAALGFLVLPRLASADAPASLTRAPKERVVNVCPWRSDAEREQVLRAL